jgi:hypothetical protein
VAETGSMVENLRDSHELAKDRDFILTRYLPVFRSINSGCFSSAQIHCAWGGASVVCSSSSGQDVCGRSRRCGGGRPWWRGRCSPCR